MIGKFDEVITYLTQSERDKPDALWNVEEYKSPRTDRQRKYYWTLLSEVARKRKLSKAYVHNQQLRAVRFAQRIGDNLIEVKVPDTDEAERQIMESSEYHLCPTNKRDGDKRIYVMLRGSSELNTAETAYLLEMLIQDAQAIGINTLTPDELEKMRMYDQEHEDKRNARQNKSKPDTEED